MSSLILRYCIRVSQNLEVNLVSQSQMIDSGSPVYGNMWVKYRSAISSLVTLVLVSYASIYLLKQFLYTKIELYQILCYCKDSNRPMKSMEKCVSDMTSMSDWCKSLVRSCVNSLLC